MSIPKEPRQLMINIMYLVLTALLALNVSAEVMNAFFTLDKGNQESMATVDTQLASTVSGLDELLKDASKEKYRPIQPAIQQVQTISKDFNTYVNALRDQIVDAAGNNNDEIDDGDFKESFGKLVPKGKKNKDVTTRILVDGTPEAAPKGEELKQKIIDTRQQLIDVYTNLLTEHGTTFGLTNEQEVQTKIQSVAQDMPFNIDDQAWQDAGKTSWGEYKFRQMPVAAVLPLMSQMQSDLKSSEANMINDMASLAGGRVIEFNQFFPVVQADKSYVIGGEKFNAKISVGSYSSSLDPSNVKLTLNGTALRINEDGTADYSTTASGQGPKTLKLGVEVTNPLTGETTTGDSEFTYEVGTRSVAVAADKMNVFYIGVDNPVTVSAAGVASADVRVNFSGANGKKIKGSQYNVTANAPGEASVTVTAKGKTLGSFPFRVKRIPNPEARLSGSNGGGMRSGEFKAQGGVGAFLDDFDFDAKCQIAGYELVKVAKRQDPVPSNNKGARYNDKSKRLVQSAKPGDTYYFNNVRGKCPGDKATRKLNSMVFNIK